MDICRTCDANSLHDCTALDLCDAAEDLEASSSDGEQAAMEAEDAEGTLEEEAKGNLKKEGGGANAAFPVEGLFVHKVKETAHKLKDAHHTACGIVADPLKYDYFFEGESVPREHLCWRLGCAPWVGTQSESPAPVSPDNAGARRRLK